MILYSILLYYVMQCRVYCLVQCLYCLVQCFGMFVMGVCVLLSLVLLLLNRVLLLLSLVFRLLSRVFQYVLYWCVCIAWPGASLLFSLFFEYMMYYSVLLYSSLGGSLWNVSMCFFYGCVLIAWVVASIVYTHYIYIISSSVRFFRMHYVLFYAIIFQSGWQLVDCVGVCLFVGVCRLRGWLPRLLTPTIYNSLV